jgi:hypothetical protein
MEYITTGITTLGLIIVAVLQLRAEKYRKNKDKAEEAEKQVCAEQRTDDLEMSIAKGQMIAAAGELSFVTSLAVTGGHINGNVEAAQKAYTSASKAYQAQEAKLARKYLKAPLGGAETA